MADSSRESKVIAVFGSGKCMKTDSEYMLAEQLGEKLGEAGFCVANGGYGGTMLACSEGASRHSAKVIGVTCRAFGSSEPNEYVTENIKADTLRERLFKLIDVSDGFVVLGGGTGTLQELAMVWESKNKGFECSGKPIILLGDFWVPLVRLIGSKQAKAVENVSIADNADKAVEILKGFFNVCSG